MNSNSESLWNDTTQSFFPGTGSRKTLQPLTVLEDGQYWKASLENALVGKRNIMENQDTC